MGVREIDRSLEQWQMGVKDLRRRMILAPTPRERIFANPMATAAAIDRVVHHSVILEFAVPSYRTNAAQQRGQAKEVNRQN